MERNLTKLYKSISNNNNKNKNNNYRNTQFIKKKVEIRRNHSKQFGFERLS